MRKCLMLIVITLFICCSSPDPVEQADALEQELETVLDGGDANFDHIDIEEGSDAAVIRGEIASLELDITLREIEGVEVPEFIDQALEEYSEEVEGKSGRSKFAFLAGVYFMNDDAEKPLNTITDIYASLEKLRGFGNE